MGLGGVILAAGESSRMGRDKALLPWPPAQSTASQINQSISSRLPAVPAVQPETLLSAAINALSPFCDMVIVVAGKNESKLRTVVDQCGAFLAVNPCPARGQFSSLQVGMREVLNWGRDAAMVTLVDRPPARSSTLANLVDAFDKRDRTKWAIVPEFEGKHGHPIVIGREMMEAFLKAPPEANAREIEHTNESRIAYTPVDDARVILNINTPEDYAGLEL